MNIEKIIRSVIAEKGIKMDTVYNSIGMSNSGFYAMLRNNTIKVDTLEKIAEVLDIPVVTFFDNADTKSKEKDNEILNLRTQVVQLNELNAVYKKLIDMYESESIESVSVSSAIYTLNNCFRRSELANFSEEQKEKIRLYVRKNSSQFEKLIKPIFDKYEFDSIRSNSDEVLYKPMSDAILTFIEKKGILK